MRFITHCLAVILLIISSTTSAYGKPLRLVIPQYPPFMSEKDGEFNGIGVNKVDQLMQKLAIDYQLRSVPNHARALEEIKYGKADGFFLATESKQRNQFATLSAPLMYNAWSWFLLKNSHWDPKSQQFREEAKVGTVHGSNTSVWLQENRYNVTSHPHSPCYLPRLLIDLRRIDAVFVTEKVFKAELLKQSYPNDIYREVIEIAKPFGIYISNDYLTKHASFMDKLNQEIAKTEIADKELRQTKMAREK